MPKIAQKRQTTLKNAFKTQEISTPVKKLARTASAASATFSISDRNYLTLHRRRPGGRKQTQPGAVQIIPEQGKDPKKILLAEAQSTA